MSAFQVCDLPFPQVRAVGEGLSVVRPFQQTHVRSGRRGVPSWISGEGSDLRQRAWKAHRPASGHRLPGDRWGTARSDLAGRCSHDRRRRALLRVATLAAPERTRERAPVLTLDSRGREGWAAHVKLRPAPCPGDFDVCRSLVYSISRVMPRRARANQAAPWVLWVSRTASITRCPTIVAHCAALLSVRSITLPWP